MSARLSFDRQWEEDIYARGAQLNRYPFDAVVSFLFRHAPRTRPRSALSVLEVGCGVGNNLWFAAREGFQVSGIDASSIAIRAASERFAAEGLVGDLRVGDFCRLPFEDARFDLAIDRQALTCVPRAAAREAVRELARVLRPGGKLFSSLYSARHTSASAGEPGGDGLVRAIRGGTLAGLGQIRFYDAAALDELYAAPWIELAREHVELTSSLEGAAETQAEWRVVAQNGAQP